MAKTTNHMGTACERRRPHHFRIAPQPNESDMTISPAPPELVALASRAAGAHALWPELVCAIVEQESAWNPWALRYEPAFYERYIAPFLTARRLDRPDSRLAALTSPGIPDDPTESRARAFSWGLMQVIGQVAREHGFTGV
jgi:soluble lytic murein transglycosylase-like protein